MARAETYPARPVRIIVGTPAGASPDVTARIVAQWLSQRLGQPFVVEDRDGAAGSIAAQSVARSAPDGYTLLLFSASAVINPAVYAKLNVDFARDIAPVASIVTFANVITVNPSFPAKTLPDFIAYAKTHPGKINLGTPGVGAPQYVAAALFKMMTGVDIVVVPYRGGPAAVTDALSGQIQGMIGTVLLTLPQIQTRTLIGLAVTGAVRSDLLPDIPTVSEFVPGFEASQWIGIGAPKRTPEAIVDRLHREINAGLADPAIGARIAALGGTAIPKSRSDFSSFIAAETEKWGKVVKSAAGKAS